ncbi:MAG TPA: hypothetical protein VI854_07845, partial [Acidimicrobiia bacterium]|nr:hypothetical protein [Acidimicrobiia bacterium]
MPDDETPRQRAARRAAGQHGAISHAQLLDAGLTPRQVTGLLTGDRYVATGPRSIYRAAGSPPSWQQDLWVALLAAPAGTVASHRSVAALFDLLPPPDVPEITVRRGVSGRFGGAALRRSSVPREDRCRVQGFPATTPARMIVDCAAVLDQNALNELVDSAIGRRLVTYRRIEAARERAGRRRGTARLCLALAPYAGGAQPGSPAAARMLRRLHEWGLPAPVCEYKVRDVDGRLLGRLDFAWPEWLAGLE